MNPQNKRNWYVIILLLVIVKVSLFLFLISQNYYVYEKGSFARCGGDYLSYIVPIESFIDHGKYEPDYRMPGYGVIYGIFYLFLSRATALNFLVIFQILLDVTATILLIKGLSYLNKNNYITLFAILFYGIGITITTYTNHVLTESVSASLIAISFFFLSSFYKFKKSGFLFFSSFFSVWAYFCRPIFFPFFILLSVFSIINLLKTKEYRNVIIFFIPFLLIQGGWSTINYLKKDKLFLLTETKYYPGYSQATLASWEFIKCFDDFKAIYFFPDADFPNRTIEIIDVNDISFPKDIFTKEFNNDSLLELRRIGIFIEKINPEENKQMKAQAESIFTSKINRYTTSLKTDHPFLCYIKTPFKRTLTHIFKSSGVQFLYIKSFNDLTIIEKSIKLFFILIYIASIYGSILFVLVIFIKRKTWINIFLSLACLYSFLIHPSFLIGTSDVRYLYSFYPIFCICATLFYSSLFSILHEYYIYWLNKNK